MPDSIEQKRSRYERRRDAGLCPACGGPLAEGKSKCHYCLRVNAEKMRQLRKIRLFQHVCTYCGGELDKPELVACTNCLARRHERRARRAA